MQRTREYLESLAIFKTRIDFTVWVTFKNGFFGICL